MYFFLLPLCLALLARQSDMIGKGREHSPWLPDMGAHCSVCQRLSGGKFRFKICWIICHFQCIWRKTCTLSGSTSQRGHKNSIRSWVQFYRWWRSMAFPWEGLKSILYVPCKDDSNMLRSPHYRVEPLELRQEVGVTKHNKTRMFNLILPLLT